MQPVSGFPQPLIQQLQRLRRRLTAVTVAGGLGLTLFVLGLSIAGLMLLDMLVDLPQAVRAGLVGLAALGVLALAGWTVLRPLWRKPSEVELAALVESTWPELNERLLSTVEFAQQTDAADDGSSSLMRQWVVNQTLQFAGKHDLAEVVDGRRAVRRCWLGGIALLALLIPLLFATEAYAVLWSRLFNPWGNYERIQNLVLEVEEADRVVGRGDDVTIHVRPSWRFAAGTRPEFARLDWRPEEAPAQQRRLDWDPLTESYTLTLPRVDQSFDYAVSAGQARTRLHRIDVVDRPEIGEILLDVVPPSYTGRPATQHDALLGEVRAIEQSRLDFVMSFNKPVATAEILWLDGPGRPLRADQPQERLADGSVIKDRSLLELSSDRTSARLNMTAALDGPAGRFLVRVVDDFDLLQRREDIRRLTIEADQAPTLEFADREQHAEARPQDTLSIPVRAADDFGLAAVEVHYEFLGQGTTLEKGTIPLPPELTGTRHLDHAFLFDLAPLKVSPGTQIALRVRAADERPVPGPNETWTGTRIISVSAEARPYGDQTLAEQQHRADQVMDKLHSEIEKQEQQARKLQADAQTDAARKNEWKREDQVQELEDNLDALQEQMQKLGAVLAQQPLFEHLARQAEQIANESLAQAEQSVEQAAQAPLDEKPQAFDEAARKLNSASSEFEKLQQKFDELTQMQRDLLDLNRLAINTEQLAGQVEDLVQRQQELPPPGKQLVDPARDLWNQDHQRLTARHEQLEKDLGQLLDRRPDLIEKARENLQQQMALLSEQADQLARAQAAIANSVKEEGRAEGKALQDVRRAQDQLIRDEKKLAQELGLPGSEQIDVNGVAETRKAQKSLTEGNLLSAEQQHQRAGEQLAELAAALRQNADLPQEPRQRLEELQNRQQQLAEQLKQLPDEPTEESRQQMTRLAAEQAALRRAAAELPLAQQQRPQAQAASDRLAGAAQALAEAKPAEAREQAKQAAEGLQQLAEALKQAGEEAQPTEKDMQASQQEATRTEEINQNLADLVQRQADVARQIAAARPETPPATPAGNEAPPATAQAPATPPDGQSPPGEPTGAPPAPASEQNAAAPNAPAPSTPPGTPPQPSPLELAQRQQQLYEQARQLGEQVRSAGTPGEETKKASHSFPDAARQASDGLKQLSFRRAAEASQRAAEQSQKLAEQAAGDQALTLPEETTAQLQAASQAQQQLAGEMQALAQSSEQQQAFREALQQSVSQQTSELAEQLQGGAEELTLPRMERQAHAELAEQAGTQATTAQQSMSAASTQAQQGNKQQASESGQAAAQSLRTAAGEAKQAANGFPAHRNIETRVPGDVGRQVAQSSKQLEQAGEQLAQLGTPQASSSQQQGQQGQQGEGQSGQQQGENNQPSGQPSGQQQAGQQDGQQSAGMNQNGEQAPGADPAGSLRNAAQNLRNAAEQLGLNMAQQARQQQGESGNESPQSPSSQASDTGFSGNASLAELETALGNVSARDWGKLPGTLQTELLESAQRQPDATYRGVIRRYFQEISKNRPAEFQEAPAP